MTDKIEFPTGVELPLRGGGVAVLYEFWSGEWFGRARASFEGWTPTRWREDGTNRNFLGAWDILPPKRKAWVVWFKHRPPRIVHRKPEMAWIEEPDEDGPPEIGVVQEITEP